MSEFANRLRKRHKHLSKFADRWPTNAYRVYDWDMPTWPFAVDLYGDRVHMQEFVRRGVSDEEREAKQEQAIADVVEVLGVDEDDIYLKERFRKKAHGQYVKQARRGEDFQVTEGPHRFWVNLEKYIDTGLFLDHRNLRREVAERCKALKKELGRQPKLLNLFAYTGAFSVWAAAAGARTTTVDLSNTYLDWSKNNFRLNELPIHEHAFERSDILRWLPQNEGKRAFDLIVLDPPTWSRSKKMEREFEVQNGYVELIYGAMKLLGDGGTLYFSTNFRDFEMDASLFDGLELEEITYRTVPQDFREGVHRSWEIRRA